MTFSAAVASVARISSLCEFLVLTFYFFLIFGLKAIFFQPDFFTSIWGLLLHSSKPVKILNVKECRSKPQSNLCFLFHSL